ncbi:AfsR/SARP family transcriptional regulator [Streptomyces profundus]|uniref:AfsR/SARP family transcriptional regulator n=1 Tax=Streptomyces profundus TaxID=2867410 RepID=UPI001D1650F5|nr:AfsR/SARP family transcriptional regulator [Streptomyces sp. MA3_2.13]UED88038.1 transcriptional regulator [Streptomyces sp. MA3_2.13]
MEFRILGPVGARQEGRPLALVAEKPRTVLAALLLAGDRVVSDTYLRDVVWGPTPPSTVDQQLYTYVSRLRKLVSPGATILRHRPGYQLVLADATVDQAEFERLTDQGYDALRAGRHGSAAERLARALALWRGPALGGVTDYLSRVELPQLEEARMAALEGRIEADLALGRHDALVSELVGLVEAHPLRERLRAQLMTALYRTGRQADALAAYQRGREVLAEELGIDPSSTLNDVFQSILSGDPGLAAPAAAPQEVRVQPRRRVRPAMLPPGVADFTGRERQLRELAVLLGQHGEDSAPPVVVTGAAGVGKSALAVQAGRRGSDAFPGGRLYADLGGESDRPRNPHEVLDWFLQALCEPGTPLPATAEVRTQLYRSLLAERRVLVVLDNARDERQVRPLLPGAAGSRVVVTARSRFTALEGAHRLELDGFERAEALALLRRVAGPHRVAAEPDVAEALVDRCGRLPIAVRVVAGRLAAKPHWTLAEMARRLTDVRRRPLDELRLADRDVRRSLESSYRRLTAEGRSALGRLALLHAPEIPAWLAAVVLQTDESQTEDILESLVDTRLLEVAGRDPTGRPRCRLRPVVHLFARERAEAESDAAERYATVDRALTAWLLRARAAVRALADERHDVAAGALGWFETERNGFAAALHQADAEGHGSTARALAGAWTDLRTLRGAADRASRPAGADLLSATRPDRGRSDPRPAR